MAVLTFSGAEAVLAAQAATLPQPDQLCGPFAARAALHSVLDPDAVPGVVALAAAAGTTVWPHDVAANRPPGAPWDRTGWDRLPEATAPGTSGTDAAGLARGIVATTEGAVAVVPVSGAGADAAGLEAVLMGLATAERPVGVVANVRTGALDPDGGWDVGHFVVLWALDVLWAADAVDADDAVGVGVAGPEVAQVAVADTYRELGAPGEPPGCRWVPLARLADGLGGAPARGLLLLVPAEDEAPVTELVRRAGPEPILWAT